jgi:hypothetical protein
MKQLLFSLAPSVVMVVLMFAVAYPAIWLNRLQQRRKRSPLTSELLRSPGESLRMQIDDLNDKIDTALFGVSAIPISLYAMWLSQVYFKMMENTFSNAALYLVIAVGFLIYQARTLYNTLGRRNNLRLGLDCEQAVGQELNQLMLDGCRVFHDFDADGFNIDHIVIGSNGVFAIETKGRAKPDRGRGKEDVRVVYDGKSLQFPTWKETEPLEQAKRQAVWLSSWLTKATGDQIVAKPALALPGWYVDRQGKDLLVYSGKNPRFIATISTETPLTAAMIERAAYQIEQKCRDVEPQAYKKQ